MSLQRYINKEDLLAPNSPRYAQLYTVEDVDVLAPLKLVPNEPKLINDEKRSEIHVYTFYGDYLVGNHANQLTFLDKGTNSFLVDVRGVFQQANISKGSYVVVYNLFQSVWGALDHEKVFVKEISPNRTELQLTVDSEFLQEFQTFQSYVTALQVEGTLNNLAINFAFNRIGKVTNIRFQGNDTIFVKLYQPIEDEITEKSWAWFDLEVLDPYVDSVILTNPVSQGSVNYVGGPNFDIDVNSYASNSTPFKSWDDLLNGDLATNQRIIDRTLSGSLSTKLNIDYTAFPNFVFYSSAEERIRNLHYKVSKIEEYSGSISLLYNSTASNSLFVSSSVDLNQRRIDQITTAFTPFERWSYYSSTGSIFSHDLTGSITPFPKRIVDGRWQPHTVSSSIVSNWYSNLIVSASDYDQRNVNRLYWSVPEHIIMDEGNSNFLQFVDMVGEHFDELYAFIRALPQIHEKEEHPERGVSANLLPHIAKSFGWELQNTRQLADLWKYKLGTNQTGQYSQTGSMFSLSQENQTHQIWRRIVNNLPYLLKTRGTGRVLKALMNIYGIPQTLISIKEYGGPSPSDDRPTIIEDRFAYALNFTGSQYVQMARQYLPAESGSWGGAYRVPDTVEFRFKTNVSSSVSMSLWAIEDGTDRNRVNNLELVHYIAANPGTSSYQGSPTYGFLRYTGVINSGSIFLSSSVQSDYLPLFDNDFWTVRIQTPQNLYTNPAGQINFNVAGANDSLYGRISHSSSFSFYPTTISGSGINLNARVFLQGPFVNASGTMSDGLRTAGYIPTTEPYTVSGSWHVNGAGGETVSSGTLAINSTQSIVDWIFVDLRHKNNPGHVLHSRSGLLRRDGYITDTDGSSSLNFPGASADYYYVAVRHRNHLAFRTSTTQSLSSTALSLDFTNNSISTQNPLKLLTSSYYGMYSGDANQDGLITQAIDRDLYYSLQSGTVGYRSADFDLNGTVNATDRNAYLTPNYGQSSSLEPNITDKSYLWGGTSNYIVLGGTTGSRSNRFVGQIHGYKEWFEVISDDVFKQHVLNPAQYSGNEATSSFKTLYRYFPLGLDQQRWDHSVYVQVSSSQPNRIASFGTTASFFNFTGSEAQQYRSVNETYYITPPTLAGNTFRSEKIRLESSQLFRNLSLTGKSEISAYDKAGFDTNRLAVVFAPNDHVNFDIFNQFGFARLDNYIGDPEYEFEEEYSELRQFREEYLKKYQRSNDVNALIRILALYDYTFFEQVKQSVPGRADLITGILLESDFLHRPKARITRRPTIENPQYDADIPGTNPETTGEIEQLEGSSSNKPYFTTRYSYYTGSFNNVVSATSRYNYLTGSAKQEVSGSSRMLHHYSGSRNPFGGTIDTIPTRYSGSQGSTQSYVDLSRQNCCYSKVIFHYSSSGTFSTKYERLWYTAVSMSYGMYYSRSLECGGYQNNECFVSNNHRFRGSKLEGAGINIDSTQTIDGGPVITVWEANPNRLTVGDSPLGGKLIVE